MVCSNGVTAEIMQEILGDGWMTTYPGGGLMGRGFDTICVTTNPTLTKEMSHKEWYTKYLPTKLYPKGKIYYIGDK